LSCTKLATFDRPRMSAV